MRARRLGRTGFEVSEIGFGAWGIGGMMWRGGDDARSRRALEAALDAGVTFIDTALVYGDGHSERLIGDVMAGQKAGRGRIVVATKIPPKDRVWPGRAETPLARTFPSAHLTACVERSLKNLRTDALDLEQLHVWNDAWLTSPAWEATRRTMDRLQQEGKVRHWGISINDHAPHTALKVAADPLIETVQVIYNIYDRSPERELFALAHRQDLGVIARVPFDEGGLTGKLTSQSRFPDGDWRRQYFAGDRLPAAVARAAALAPLLGDEAAGLPELALRFCLSNGNVSTVIPGMRSEEHVRANTAVSDGRPLSGPLLARLADHAWPKNWYGD